ncbi:MAG: Mur ligase domain-containing protein [Fibrobacterales bacterium]
MDQHNERDLESITSLFFIGVGGVGMSAIAQYVSGIGKKVAGSDRQFIGVQKTTVQEQLEEEGVSCFPQDGSGIDADIDVVVISTAIENDNTELVKAKALGITVLHRSEMLTLITNSKKTIALSGTSGKSTTAGMLFHVMRESGWDPSFISGAGLVSLQKEGKIGNAFAGSGEWLIIEADESDGTLVNYTPEVGVILNLDKDHKEMDELHEIFATFKSNVKDRLIVNFSHPLAKGFSQDETFDFCHSCNTCKCVVNGNTFQQDGFEIFFKVKGVDFKIPVIGRHNMENALAVCAVTEYLGISLEQVAWALSSYGGIYRRHQLIGVKDGITIIDDYAHNPAKIAASIESAQGLGGNVYAWFQPHGYGPTRFLRSELVKEISSALRGGDEIWMSEIYYAGGTAVKDISAGDLIDDIVLKGKKARFIENRAQVVTIARNCIAEGDVLLLMGARDPSLAEYAYEVYQGL